MKSLNKVQLIGNLTRDPELKFTPSGSAVCTFTVATNRGWTTDTGEKKEEADFTRVVAWNKLAEICGQLLKKGRKVYVEGRLSNRSYQDKDGQTKYITEVVIVDMILLDSKSEGLGVEEVRNEDKSDESKITEEKGEESKTDESEDIPF
jgi:single-strand DNA-binding protein